MSITQLEARVKRLEDEAGPGRAAALTDNLMCLRQDVTKIRTTQDRHTRILGKLKSDVSTLKSDVSTLKSDVSTIKDTLKEVLRRLPDDPESD
jgi:septal ring factor EnvC (AmiA/AmiB activator)